MYHTESSVVLKVKAANQKAIRIYKPFYMGTFILIEICAFKLHILLNL